jgi:hypothetical protein
MIGNVTALIKRNRVSALCIEGSGSSDHSDPAQPSGYGSSWPEKIICPLFGETSCRKNEKVTGKIRRNPQ